MCWLKVICFNWACELPVWSNYSLVMGCVFYQQGCATKSKLWFWYSLGLSQILRRRRVARFEINVRITLRKFKTVFLHKNPPLWWTHHKKSFYPNILSKLHSSTITKAALNTAPKLIYVFFFLKIPVWLSGFNIPPLERVEWAQTPSLASITSDPPLSDVHYVECRHKPGI